jgi:hypothetical protein
MPRHLADTFAPIDDHKSAREQFESTISANEVCHLAQKKPVEHL